MSRDFIKDFLQILGGMLLLIATQVAFADTLGDIAAGLTGSMGNLNKLITAASYVVGFGFAVAGIVKFKAHKEAPTQVAISVPIVLLFVGAGLIFLPSLLKALGMTMFTSVQQSGVGSVSGFTTFLGGS